MIEYPGDGRLKKITILILFFLISGIILTPPIVNAGLILWPGKLTIDIPKGFPDEEITYNKITVKNPYDYDIIVITEINDPPIGETTDGYTNIPDLSWVKINPETQKISARSEGYFNLSIDIPEDEKSSHYNEKWEVRVIVFKKPDYQSGNLIVNMKLASKIYIHTPEGVNQMQIPTIAYVVTIIILGATTFYSFVVYYKKKHNKKLKQ